MDEIAIFSKTSAFPGTSNNDLIYAKTMQSLQLRVTNGQHGCVHIVGMEITDLLLGPWDKNGV